KTVAHRWPRQARIEKAGTKKADRQETDRSRRRITAEGALRIAPGASRFAWPRHDHCCTAVNRRGFFAAPLFRRLLGKSSLLALDELRPVGRNDIEFGANPLRFAGCQPTHAEIAVDARDHALKNFLIRLPGDGHDLLFIR